MIIIRYVLYSCHDYLHALYVTLGAMTMSFFGWFCASIFGSLWETIFIFSNFLIHGDLTHGFVIQVKELQFPKFSFEIHSPLVNWNLIYIHKLHYHNSILYIWPSDIIIISYVNQICVFPLTHRLWPSINPLHEYLLTYTSFNILQFYTIIITYTSSNKALIQYTKTLNYYHYIYVIPQSIYFTM